MITDQAMPLMDGRALAERIHGLAPELPVLMVTGYQEPQEGAGGARLPGVRQLLHKPLPARELLQAVEAALHP